MRAAKKEVVSPLDLWKNTYPIDLHGEKFLIISPFISQYDKMARLFAKIQSNFDLKGFYERELWGIEENKIPEAGRTFASDELLKPKSSDLLFQSNIDSINSDISKLDNLIKEVAGQVVITQSEIEEKVKKIAIYEQMKKKMKDSMEFQTLLSYIEKHTNDALDLLSVFMVKESTYQTMIKDNLEVEDVIKETKQALSLINSIPTIFGLAKLVLEVNPDFFMKQKDQVIKLMEMWKAEKIEKSKATTQSSMSSNS